MLDEGRDSLLLDPSIAYFRQVLKSVRAKVALDAYLSFINDSVGWASGSVYDTGWHHRQGPVIIRYQNGDWKY